MNLKILDFLSHCYEREKALEILDDIQNKYLPALEYLYELFLVKVKEIS